MSIEYINTKPSKHQQGILPLNFLSNYKMCSAKSTLPFIQVQVFNLDDTWLASSVFIGVGSLSKTVSIFHRRKDNFEY